jgi:hypothetical protein
LGKAFLLVTLSIYNVVQGIPVAYFPDTNCDFPTHFQEHTIVINLTLCMWAPCSIIGLVELMCDLMQAVTGPATYILRLVLQHALVSFPLARVQRNDFAKSAKPKDFVNKNPQAFTDAYFDFAAIRVYEQ